MSETLKPDLAEIMLELAKNTQAGSALVTTAVLDQALQKLLLAAMRPLSNNVAETILGDYAPLYEIAPKTDIAYAFELIDEQTYASLKAVIKIRNKFAHTDKPLSFESQ